MNNTIQEVNIDGLDIKLTTDKLFISTATSSEAFALRSIDGVGVVDLVSEYNNELVAWKKRTTEIKVFRIIMWIFLAVGLIFLLLSFFAAFIIMLVIAGIYYAVGNRFKKNNNEPKLMSAVRIMMTGGNRDFQFNKNDTSGIAVAQFVAKIETTLTAYHKDFVR